MGLLTAVTDFIGGSIFKEIKDGVMAYFPPNLTPKEKADFELRFQELLDKKQLAANRILDEAGKQLDQRIAEQEGTAKDLKAIPFLGPIILFLRGLQRPAWGYATMIMDFKWFFELHSFTEQQQTAMIVINFLVLGFLFGERTIKNLEPLLIKIFSKGV